MATLADIQAALAAEETVEQQVITLLQTLSADLQNALNGGNPAAIQAIVDQMNTDAAAMAAAVAANQPPPGPTGTTGPTGP